METKTDISDFTIRFLSNITQLEAAQWNQVCGNNNPFICHEFLSALEQTGCVNVRTGWEPHHVTVYLDGQLVAVMPLYIKHHSYGEYVFDWAWAEAYQRHQIDYYPKLLTAIPFTPSTGPRLCVTSHSLRNAVSEFITHEIIQLAEVKGYSSWHLLFPEAPEQQSLSEGLLNQRIGCQFHWFNQKFLDFDHFLSTFASRKRKKINRERRRITEQGLTLVKLTGDMITTEHLQTFYHFYQATYLKRAQQGYLTYDFFLQIHQKMPENILLVLGYKEDKPVAGAFSFIGEKTLYGRYWGCLEEFEGLHFEACYYQGIEFCIEHGLEKFDPGAQGEHKISRGFEPIKTYSYHWIAHPGFKQAIDRFLIEEHEGIENYIESAKTVLPFKKE